MNRKIRRISLVLGLCSVMVLGYTPQAMAAKSTAAAAQQQAKRVKGSVYDSMGPIMGATVMEKGTNNGAITDVDGNFVIKLNDPNATLVVSYLGYVTQEIKVGGKSEVFVSLESEDRNLNEVVVIGYGTQRKEAVTGSVASVKGESLREVPGADITQALQGRIAGVQMMQTSSKPGASMQIRIRGQRSLTASNDPLIVLDGIPFAGSLNDIDPASIKSMDILKDASATAIYGSRGANGVIMITTNKGTKEMAPIVKYNMYVGAKTNFSDYPMMNGDELAELRKVAGKGYDMLTSDEKAGMNTNWQDLFFKTGFTTNQDVSVAGGGSSTNYNFGVSYLKDEATIPTQNFNRYAFHAAIDQEIGRYVKVGFASNTNYSVTNNANLGLYTILSASPLVDPYNEDGSLKSVAANNATDKMWVTTRERIENLGDSYKDQTTALGTYNNFYGEVKAPFLDGLKYRINLGLNYRHNKYGSYTGTGIFSDTATNPSSAANNNATTWNWAVEHLVSYDKTFGDHTINAVALYSAEKTHYDAQSMSGTKIPNDQFLWYNIGQAESTTINPANQGYYECGLTSIMGRIMYSYQDKYMASVTVRRDGSSRLAKGHQYHTYPAVSLGWNIAKESFMENVKWVDNLKLRLGYGQTSNQSVNPYATLGLLSSTAYNYGSTGYTTGYYVSSLPNQELGWEYSQTYNVGLDFSFLNGRIYGTAEYYIQKTNDLLMSVSLPSTAGVSSYTANVGKTQNKGFELSLNGIILDNKDGWTVEAGLNWYTNKNKIVELADGSDRDEGNGWFVGKSINSIYDYEKIGIWQTSEEETRQIMEPGGNAGMIKVKGGYYTQEEADAGAIPEGKKVGDMRAINAYDRQVIELDPAWEGGFNFRVAYKNFDLSAVTSFRHGGKLISTLYGSASYLNMLSGRRNNVKVDYWTESNPTNAYPNPAGIQSGDNPKYGNSLALFSGSYFKFRTITLGYNFAGQWMKTAGIKALRVYATVTNPFVLFSPYTNETGLDPETNSRGNENQAVGSYNSRILVVGYNTPTTRNYLLGLNVTF